MANLGVLALLFLEQCATGESEQVCPQQLPGGLDVRSFDQHITTEQPETRITEPSTGPRDEYVGDEEFFLQQAQNGNWVLLPVTHWLSTTQSHEDKAEVRTPEGLADKEQFTLMGLSDWLTSIKEYWPQIDSIVIDRDRGEQKISIFHKEPVFVSPDRLHLDLAHQVLIDNQRGYYQQPGVEEEVRLLCEQIQSRYGPQTAVFHGKAYRVGQDMRDLNADLNKSLKEARSQLRVIISNAKNPLVFWGTLQREEQVTIEGQSINVMYLEMDEQNITSAPFVAGGVFVEPACVGIFVNVHQVQQQKLLAELQKGGTSIQPEWQEAFLVFGTGMIADESTTTFEWIKYHELGHAGFYMRYGSTLKIASEYLPENAAFTLLALKELAADCNALKYIEELRKTDPEKATRALCSLVCDSIYRDSQFSDGERDYTQMTIRLVLSSVTIKQGGIEIDWEKLSQKTNELDQMINQYYDSQTRWARETFWKMCFYGEYEPHNYDEMLAEHAVGVGNKMGVCIEKDPAKTKALAERILISQLGRDEEFSKALSASAEEMARQLDQWQREEKTKKNEDE